MRFVNHNNNDKQHCGNGCFHCTFHNNNILEVWSKKKRKCGMYSSLSLSLTLSFLIYTYYIHINYTDDIYGYGMCRIVSNDTGLLSAIFFLCVYVLFHQAIHDDNNHHNYINNSSDNSNGK